MGAANQIPKPVATALKKCWPDGVIEEFETDESYFHEIHPQLERDLRNICGAALLWQTEEPENGARWDDDNREDEPPPGGDWQPITCSSSPRTAKNSTSQTKRRAGKSRKTRRRRGDRNDVPGRRLDWLCSRNLPGCALCGPPSGPLFALRGRGRTWLPDLEPFPVSDETDERVDSDQYYREILSGKAFQHLEDLRGRIAAVLVQHRIDVLDKSVLDVPRLAPSKEVFMEEPLRVRDAFFFR